MDRQFTGRALAALAAVALVLALGSPAAGAQKPPRPGEPEGNPPAVARFVGAIRIGDWEFAPWGLAVEAYIGEGADLTLCGLGRVAEEGRYAVDVYPVDEYPGCGTEGAAVLFTLGSGDVYTVGQRAPRLSGIPLDPLGEFRSGRTQELDLVRAPPPPRPMLGEEQRALAEAIARADAGLAAALDGRSFTVAEIGEMYERGELVGAIMRLRLSAPLSATVDWSFVRPAERDQEGQPTGPYRVTVFRCAVEDVTEL